MTQQEFKDEVLKTDYSNLEEITWPPKTMEKWPELIKELPMLELIKEVPMSEAENTLIYRPTTITTTGTSSWKTFGEAEHPTSIYNSDSFDKDYEEWEKDNIETIKFLEFSSVDVKSAREIAEYFYKKALSYGGLV